MVLVDGLGDGPGEVYAFEDFIASLCMMAQDIFFGFLQGGGLVEDGGGDVKLADIVEDSGEPQAFYLACGEVQLMGKNNGELGNAFLMACGIGIANFDHGGQGINCLLMTGQDGIFVGSQL